MKKKLSASIFALTLAVTLSGCGGNNEVIDNGLHTSSTSLGVEEVLTTSAAETTTLPLMPYATEETKPAVKTKSESREEIVAGVLTAFCNNDEETYKAYSYSCSNGYKTPLSEDYGAFCRALDEQGKDWENISLSPSDFEIVYAEVEEGGKVRESGKRWYCYYKNSLDEEGWCLVLTIIFNDFDYSDKSYSL
ncbi:MAG: hypothetical protein ACI4J1_06390, partial [Ruminiclostridium sp.]